MEIGNNTTVREAAARDFGAIEIFRELGIDFCCDGGKDLDAALCEKGVTLRAFAGALERRENGAALSTAINPRTLDPRALTEYIINKHHRYLWKALPGINDLFLVVLREHGEQYPRLSQAFKVYGRLKTDLTQHLIKEETILFPRIAELHEDGQVWKLAKELKRDHDDGAVTQSELRWLADSYVPPVDACASLRRLYAWLHALDTDLFNHIRLENGYFLKDTDGRAI